MSPKSDVTWEVVLPERWCYLTGDITWEDAHEASEADDIDVGSCEGFVQRLIKCLATWVVLVADYLHTTQVVHMTDYLHTTHQHG